MIMMLRSSAQCQAFRRGCHYLLAKHTSRGMTSISSLYSNDEHKGPLPSKMLDFMEKLRSSSTHGTVDLHQSKRDSRVLELVLKHEKNRNSLTGRMMLMLHDVSLELTKDSEGKYQDFVALIVKGAQGTFCSGADFHLAQQIQTPEDGELMSELMTSTLMRLRRAPLITVAVITGAAMGGGAELATSTDFRVMSSNAKIQFVQARMGVSTGWGGTARLVKLVGRQKALQILAGALPLDAYHAKELGVVDHVVEEDDGENAEFRSWDLLAPFLAHTAEAVRAIKVGVAAADDLSWVQAREMETLAFKSTWGGPANLHAIESAKNKIGRKKKN